MLPFHWSFDLPLVFYFFGGFVVFLLLWSFSVYLALFVLGWFRFRWFVVVCVCCAVVFVGVSGVCFPGLRFGFWLVSYHPFRCWLFPLWALGVFSLGSL